MIIRKHEKKEIKSYIKQSIILLLFIIFLFNTYIIDKLRFFKNSNKCKSDFKTHCIAVIFGTRPEAVKLIPLIKELKSKNNFNIITINTGQHRKMIKQIFKSFNINNSIIDFNINVMKNNQSLTKLTYRTLLELEKIFSSINPEAIIVQGDTTTSYTSALSAYYMKIPVFHVEAGLRTYNIYSPFPEEFNRVSIDDISNLFFAPTQWAANNLLKENKNPKNIFITGNTVVDALKLTLKNTSPSKYIQNLLKQRKVHCAKEISCKIILLTCHRRENYFRPIYNILKAVEKLLKNNSDILIILPLHLNPNIRQSIKNGLPDGIYDKIIKGEIIKNYNYLYFNRFVLIEPLNYFDLIHLQSICYFIMTDSGGIIEEGVSLRKPILILRNNTERPESVYSGSAIIAGTNTNHIYYFASSLLKKELLYNKMCNINNIYGFGNSSKIIARIINNYFENKLNNLNQKNKYNYRDIIYNYDQSKINEFNDESDSRYDLVIVLNVWHRNNLERQLIQVKRQTILKDIKTNIIVFQNSNHTNITNIINKWKKKGMFKSQVNLTYIKSPLETGYFGRFLIPLTSSVKNDAYFIICDDDIIWGDRYFENMIRVVNNGYLATRNGRILDKNYHGLPPIPELWKYTNTHICFNEDIEYDFGGHIWAGRLSWLRNAWTHIPVSFENCEDFWISAVLKTYYNISTKSPKCPCPEGILINPEFCASTDKSSVKHINAQVGSSVISHNIRAKINREIIKTFNYRPLIDSNPNIFQNIKNKYILGNKNHKFFNLSDSLWADSLFWQ